MKLYPTASNKAPDNIASLEVIADGGIKLRAAYCIPPEPRGTVLILNGRADCIERYFETMFDLMQLGLAVATFDWRGQGGSQRLLANPKTGYIDSFASYDADLDAVIAQVLLAHCPKPFYGLAHSTGGHILLRALRGEKWLERAVITAPLLGFHFWPWPEFVARALVLGAISTGFGSTYLPGYNHLPLGGANFFKNPLTSDKRRFERDLLTLELHPQLALGGPSFNWLHAAIVSIDELMEWPQDRGPSCPTLVAMSGRDRVVNNAQTQKFLKRAPGFSSLTLAGSCHEALHERDEIRQSFLAGFAAFIAG